MAELGMAFLNPLAEQGRIEQSAAMAPLLQAQAAAQTRHLNVLSDTGEYNLNAEKLAGPAMAQALGKFGTAEGPPLMSTLFTTQAQIVAASGRPSEALKLLNNAATMHEHEIVAQTAQEKLSQLKAVNQQQLVGKAAQLLGDVKDEAGWNQFNSNVARVMGKSPWAGVPYDPAVVEMIHNDALSLKDRLAATARDAAVVERKRLDDATIALREARTKAAGQAAQVAAERERRLAKAGGKDVGAPSSGEVKAAGALLDATPGLVGAEDRDRAAFDVAAQAKGLRAANPGMTADEAMRQAVAAKQAAGDFVPPTPGTKVLGVEVGKGKPGYMTTLPLPASGKSSDLKAGQLYKNGAGKVAKWTGTGWAPQE